MVVWMCAVRSWAEVAPAAASTTQCGGHFFPLRGPCVIEARRLRLWDGRYDLMEDGHHVATWERSHWTIGGMIEVGGRTLMVRANLENDEASLTEAGGRRVATARGFAHKHWTIEPGMA